MVRAQEREIAQERFTSLDRELDHRAKDHRIDLTSLQGCPEGKRSLLVARLRHLEELGFAHRPGTGAWVLKPGWQKELRDLGARGDIVKQIHAAISGDPAQYRVLRQGQALSEGPEPPRPVTGRIAAKGLAHELKGTFYAVVETSGRSRLPRAHRCALL
jgi:type IV secretory pathway VirD2 relaxase